MTRLMKKKLQSEEVLIVLLKYRNTVKAPLLEEARKSFLIYFGSWFGDSRYLTLSNR